MPVNAPSALGLGLGVGLMKSYTRGPNWLLNGAATLFDWSTNSYWVGNIRKSGFAAAMTADGWTFARSSTATYVNSVGNIATAANDVYRIDRDPLTLTPYGLLIEGARTNLIQYSAALENAYWARNGTTTTTGAETAPDGTVSAVKLTENTSTNTHAPYVAITWDAEQYALSAYYKPGERVWCGPYLREDGVEKKSWFNSSTGAISTSGPGGSVKRAQQIKDGWWRFSISRTMIAGSGRHGASMSNNENVNNYAGNGTSSIYIWGVQTEKGSFPSSYIPTSGSTGTRAAETLSRTIEQPTGIALGFKVRTAPGTSGNQVIWSIGDATDGVVLRRGSNGHIFLTVYDTGSTVADLDAGGVGNIGVHSIAIVLDGTDAKICLNGGDIVSDTAAIPTLTTMTERLGSSAAGEHWFGHLRSYGVFASLDDDKLRELTTPPQYINLLWGIDSLGDSPVTGTGRYLRDVMQSRIGTASAGWVPLINASAARCTTLNFTGGGELTRTNIDVNASYKTLDLQAHRWSTVDGTSQALLTPIGPYDQIDVVWAAASGYGACDFQVSGNSTVTLDGSLTAGVYTQRVEAFVAPNAPTSWKNFTGPLSIVGVAFSRAGAGGFSYSPMGNGGWRVSDLALVDDAAMRAVIAAIRPTHFGFNGGMNDRDISSPSQFDADCRKVLDNVVAAAPNCKIIIIQSMEPSDAATSNFNAFIPIKQQLAVDYAAQFLDERAINANTVSFALANAAGYMQDFVHPKTAFSRDVMAPWLADNIIW
jgi:hypothetical protein